jgi:hypothetical protein
MLLKTNVPERQATLLRLMIAVVGMGLLVFTWFQLLRWAGGAGEP